MHEGKTLRVRQEYTKALEAVVKFLHRNLARKIRIEVLDCQKSIEGKSCKLHMTQTPSS